MLVVSLVLAVILLTAGGDDDPDSPDAVLASPMPLVATATTAPVPSATPPPIPTPPPPLPFELQQRVDALPERLRGQTIAAFASGTLSLEQLTQIVTDYENRNPAVRVGTVLSVEAGTLSFEVFTTGEQVEVATVEQTLVRRAGEDIALADLQPAELVMVVSTDEGATALTIEAFGVAAP